MANDAINHHRKAAEHFESAARHHTEAAAHFAAGRHEQAANEAYLGQGDYLHARNHAAEAARLHTRHVGPRREPSTPLSVADSSVAVAVPVLAPRSRTYRRPF
jgi:hypothetical protein